MHGYVDDLFRTRNMQICGNPDKSVQQKVQHNGPAYYTQSRENKEAIQTQMISLHDTDKR